MIFNNAYKLTRITADFWATKIDKKGKHLPNFPAVTLQALC